MSELVLSPDLKVLTDILKLKRVHDGDSEAQLLDTYIRPLPNVEIDGFGNYVYKISKPDGTPSSVLWSCHTDTVHRTDGRQALEYTADGIITTSGTECLGADDGAGVWLLLSLIDNEIPGYYVFHRQEEAGRLGAKYRVSNYPNETKQHKFAIAFDRKGTTSIITHQMRGRTCSDEFAKSLADMLIMDLTPDPTGTYTDTKEYDWLIPECTNVSVGYGNAHQATEYLNSAFLFELRDALVSRFNEDELVCKRLPVRSYAPVTTYYPDRYYPNHYAPCPLTDEDEQDANEEILNMARLLRVNAPAMARMLYHEWGMDCAQLKAELHSYGYSVHEPRRRRSH